MIGRFLKLFTLAIIVFMPTGASAEEPTPKADANVRPAISPNASQTCSPVGSGKFDRIHLPVVAGLPAGVSWMSDWAAQPVSGGWYELQAMDACRLHMDPAFSTWHGKAAARIEVDPGDDPLRLYAGSERAEVLLPQTKDGFTILDGSASQINYFAMSYYFPPTWSGTQFPWSAFAPTDCSIGDQTQCNSWSIVMQFHLAHTAAWGFLYAAKNKPDGPQLYSLLLGKTAIRFSDGGSMALGKWTDFVFKFDWTEHIVSVWRRDEGQAKFKQVVKDVVYEAPSEAAYLKQGLYRGSAVNGRVDVLWIGPAARGESFSAVAQAAFGDAP